MLYEYGISKSMLPTIIKDSSADFGTLDAVPELKGVKISGVLGD